MVGCLAGDDLFRLLLSRYLPRIYWNNGDDNVASSFPARRPETHLLDGLHPTMRELGSTSLLPHSSNSRYSFCHDSQTLIELALY